MLDRSGGRGIIQPNTAKSNPGVSGFDLERKKERMCSFRRQAETECREFLLTDFRV